MPRPADGTSAVSRLPLTLACGPYDRMQALIAGEVEPEGIDLTYIPIQSPPEVFARMIKTRSFDVAEMSAVHYLVMRSQGAFPFVALPIFPSRLFRHGYIFVNRRSGIAGPKDLEGKRVGVQEYRMTAALWIRGILRHQYGVNTESFRWFEGGVNTPRPPDETMDLRPLKGADLTLIAPDRFLSEMLAKGEIDAYIGSRKPNPAPDVQRLFPDYRERERAFFERTGIFPIMHCLVMREDLHRQQPWVARSLFEACEKSKQRAHERLRRADSSYMLPWLGAEVDEIERLFGGDPFPYGVAANRATLDAMGQYVFEQHFVARPLRVDDFFVSVER